MNKHNLEPVDRQLRELQDEGFTIQRQFNYNTMREFVTQELEVPTTLTRSFSMMMMFFLGVLTAIAAYAGFSESISIFTFLLWLFAGAAVVLPLITIHEWIHGIFFKMYGAEKVRYKVLPKKLMAMAIVHGQAFKPKPMIRVALAPLIILGAISVALMIFLPQPWNFAAAGFFVFHTMCCGGDIAVVNYILRNKDSELLFLDDMVTEQSYILIRSTDNEPESNAASTD